MTKEIKDGQEYWEDRVVEEHIGHFTTKFPIDDDVSLGISDGDLISFVVTARADGASYKSIKNSTAKSKDRAFVLQAVSPLDSDKAAYLYDQMDQKVFGVNDGLVETTQVAATGAAKTVTGKSAEDDGDTPLFTDDAYKFLDDEDADSLLADA